MALSKNEIKARMEELISIDRFTGWTSKEEEEFDRLLELHPEETKDDMEYLMIMGESSFLQRIAPIPEELKP
tara:strand:- start:129 stop:344 length:216 start_codon:yes stop_codon:yes gene_type:complete